MDEDERCLCRRETQPLVFDMGSWRRSDDCKGQVTWPRCRQFRAPTSFVCSGYAFKTSSPTQHYMECSEVPNAASYGCLCIHGVRLLLCSMRRCPASRLQTRCFSWKISAQLRSDPWRIRCLLERLFFSLAILGRNLLLHADSPRPMRNS